MSLFDIIETSRNRSTPVELYRIDFGENSLRTLSYTDHEKPLSWEGVEYTPLAISRNSFDISGGLDNSGVEVTMPMRSELPEMFRVYPPGQQVFITILRGHFDDPEEFRIVFRGRVTSPTWDGVSAKMTCQPTHAGFGTLGLRRHYQYGCPHQLYGPQCKAQENAATSAGIVRGISGRVVELELRTRPANWFAGGILRWVGSQRLPNSRTILSAAHVSDNRMTFTLSGLPGDLELGSSVDALLGCPHTTRGCANIHNNIGNYGGHPLIPVDSPLGLSGAFM